MGPPKHSRGKYERERRASGSGRKRQGEGDSAAHTEVGAGGAGGRRRLAEEVGGVGRSPAPVARKAVVCSLPGTRKALIRRPEPPGGPSRPGAHVTRGPSPRPRARGGRRRRTGGAGRTAPAAGPRQGQGLPPRGGSCGPGSTHHPGSSSSPEMDEGWR